VYRFASIATDGAIFDAILSSHVTPVTVQRLAALT